jgi:hypothetical protein
MDLYADPFAAARSSECSTLPRYFANNVVAITNGTAIGCLARCTGKQTTFTGVRCMFSTVTSPTWTDLRISVHDSSGALITNGYTNSLTAASGAASAGVMLTGSLQSTGVTLTAGQLVYLAIWPSFSAGTIVMRGLGTGGGVATSVGSAPAICKTATGYTSGTPSSLGTSSNGFMPWIELT